MRSRRELTAMAGMAVVIFAAGGCRKAVSPGDGTPQSAVASSTATTSAAVPRLIDLGAGKCIPCKAMAPILEELRTEYRGRMEVHFIDVWKEPDKAGPYNIRTIPTQIFYASDGRELARHEGFISKEDILARWRSLGVEL
jgi:thioredoxin 1